MTTLYFLILFATVFLLFAFITNKLKTVILVGLLLLFSTCLFAQTVTPVDTIKPGNGPVKQQLKEIKEAKKTITDSTGGNEPKKSALIDTTIQNKYGDLLNDDIKYNKKYPLWKPAVEVLGIDVFTNAMDRALKQDFSHIGPASWKYNIQQGWEWDSDRFGINFIGHPYTGSMYFNAARSQGYNFWQSVPFAIGGSLMWEYFGETTRPSYNDVINTPINGVFLGEMFYRVSSNILDDRATGGNRVFREIAAGLVDPVRELNRLLEGKASRHTTTEVYQKEPLNITVFGGVHKINTDQKTFFGNGPTNTMINLQLDYGNPFENIRRKPFDFFKFRTEFSFGSGRKILDNVLGYGVLVGGNTNFGKLAVMYGAFQYYDYFDNNSFELGAVGFGGGVFTKLPISKDIILYTSVHGAFIPLAGNNTRFDPTDTAQYRDYTYNDGLEVKLESSLVLGKYATLSVAYYSYMLHTFVGPDGNNYINILKPRVTVGIAKNLSIGIEHFVYLDDRFLKNLAPIYSVRTEQKIFLSWFLEDPQRKGRFGYD